MDVRIRGHQVQKGHESMQKYLPESPGLPINNDMAQSLVTGKAAMIRFSGTVADLGGWRGRSTGWLPFLAAGCATCLCKMDKRRLSHILSYDIIWAENAIADT